MLSLATFAGCGSGAPSTPVDRPDTAPPPDAPGDVAVPLPASFVLRNQTGRPLYIQRDRHFELVRDWRIFPVARGCCGARECGQSLQVAVEVAPDTDYGWSWDGLALADECAAAEPMPPGPLTVRVRYSFTRSGDETISSVGATVAVDQAFVHPPAATVIVIAL